MEEKKEETQQQPKCDVEVFKVQLIAIIDDLKIGACVNFREGIKHCKDQEEIFRVFKIFGVDVAETCGVDTDKRDLERDIENLEEEVSELKSDIEELKGQSLLIPELPEYEKHSFYFQLKLKAFVENQGRFSVDEIETMFKQSNLKQA